MSVAALLASIAVFVPVPHVQVIRGACPTDPAAQECSYLDGRVYLSPAALGDGPFWAKEALAHELGHVWESRNLSDAARQRYTAAIGASGPWYGSGDLYELTAGVPPAERFADAFALCAVGPRGRARERYDGHFYVGSYGEVLSSRDVGVTCWLAHHPR